MFFKKKPVVGAHSNASWSRSYGAVSGAAAEIPSLLAWQAQTRVGQFRRDELLVQIDETIDAYWRAAEGWARLALLGRLYFLSDFFLKSVSQTDRVDYAHRASAVQGLFVTVVDKLCKCFECTVNMLPRMIEEIWGRILTPHGYETDMDQTARGGIPTVVKYIDAAKRDFYRVRIQGGRAEMRDRTQKKLVRWVPADTRGIGWEYDPIYKLAPMMAPGYAGFALSMGREFYTAHHKGAFDEKNFFHSSYLSGGAVLCTGTWLIENGVVKAIKNDSGHYQPTIEHLINAVEALQMRGVNPKLLTVTAVPYSWADVHGAIGTTELVLDGAQLLARRSLGNALHRRAQMNQINIAERDKATKAAPLPVKHLPAAPKPPPIPPRR